MSEEQSPAICVTCRRNLPADTQPDDAPRYFVQGPLRPQSDSAHDFNTEASLINGYIKAVSYVLHYSEESEIPEEVYREILSLIEELAEEADRRLTLAHEAMNEQYRRTKTTTPLEAES